MKAHPTRRWGVAALTSFLFLAGFTPAAGASEYFGQKGQFFLQGSSSLNAVTWTHNKYRDNTPTRNDLSFGLSPQMGVFLTRNFFVGADIDFTALAPGKAPQDAEALVDEALGDAPTNNSIMLSVGPRLGYNIDFGRGVSLLPTLGVGYGLTRTHGSNEHGVHADVKVPFVFQIVRHGALLVGPQIRYSTSGDKLDDPLPATVNIGLAGGLLIWI